MKKQILFGVIISLMLMVLPTNVTSAFAEEVVIQLMEVVGMTPLPGDDPLDGPTQSRPVPPCSTCFHATIDGNALSIINQEPDDFPSAQAVVVNASTGGVVVNEQFTSSLQEQISNAGVYVLHIETEGGSLVGQFVVQ